MNSNILSIDGIEDSYYYHVKKGFGADAIAPNSTSGFTDSENGDIPASIAAEIEASGKYAEIVNKYKAKVIRDGAYFRVYTPGLYTYKYLHKKTSYTTILFTEPGSYTSNFIYNSIRRGSAYFPNSVFGNIEGKEFANSNIGKCFPVKRSGSFYNVDEVLRCEIVSAINNSIHNVPETTELLTDFKFKTDNQLFNGLVAIMHFGSSVQSFALLSFLTDGTVKHLNFKDIDSTTEMNYSLKTTVINNIINLRECGVKSTYPCFSSSKHSAGVIFYDPNLRGLSMNDLAREQFASYCADKNQIIKESMTQLLGAENIPPIAFEIIDQIGPFSFIDYMNEYFRKKNMTSFEVFDVHVSTISGGVNRYNWETGYSNFEETFDACYYFHLKHKGREVISNKANTTFNWVAVKIEGDRVRLVHSNRCQHISAWSKGVTDQGYSHWEICDWITGPMAEQAKLEIKEYPVVFSGRFDQNSENRRRAVLDRLRSNMV